MVVSQFSIELDNPEAVYFAGQTVTGKLVFDVATNPETFKSIYLNCNGITKVSFNRKTYTVAKYLMGDTIFVTQTTCYTADKKHLKISFPLLTAADGRMWKFNVARHEFHFHITLPYSIPSSVEGEFGHIRYALSGHLKRTEKMKKKMMSDVHCSLNTTFINLVDLNWNPVAKMPASGTKSKNICSWCCFGKGPITAQAWINQSGYAPGEILYFNASVDNLSGKTMKGSIVQLIQEIEYFAQEKQEKSVRVIRDASHGAFGSSDVWDNVQFLIPHLVPSDERLSQHIKIRYRIEFTIHPGSCKGSKFTIPLDVIIGNIPVMNSSVGPPTAVIPPENPGSVAITVPSSQDGMKIASASAAMDDADAAATSRFIHFTPNSVHFARAADDENAALAN